MVNIFFRFWRIALFFLGLAMILFSYTAMPENVAVGFSEWGKPTKFISLQSFFYIATGLYMGINLLIGALRDQLKKVDFSSRFPNSEWATNPEALERMLTGWLDALLGFINTFTLFALVGLYKSNANADQRLEYGLDWLLLGGVALLGIILFALPLRLLFTSPKLTT